MIHVEDLEGLPKHIYLIRCQRLFFRFVLFLLAFLRHRVLALQLLIGCQTHDLGRYFSKDFFIDFKTIFHLQLYSFVYNINSNMQKLEEPIQEGSKAEISLPSIPSKYQQAFISDREMKLNVGFCILAISLKVLPIIFFFAVTDIRILVFTIVLAASAVDFWTMKNITGKQLVNMMWWIRINPDNGEQEWMFLSNQGYVLNQVNEGVFWGCCMIGNLFWGITTLLSLILSSLFWIALCALCFILNVINFVSYLKCRGNHQLKLKEFAEKVGLGSGRSLVGF